MIEILCFRSCVGRVVDVLVRLPDGWMAVDLKRVMDGYHEHSGHIVTLHNVRLGNRHARFLSLWLEFSHMDQLRQVKFPTEKSVYC